MKGVGGEVTGATVKTRPGREGGIGAPRAHGVEGEFGVGKKAVPTVIREVRVGGSEGRDKVVLASPH
jgi:hypothetical protein